MSKIHKLKCHPMPFKLMKAGIKNYEIRFNDRDYKTGDELLLEEFTPAGHYEKGFDMDIGEVCDPPQNEYSGDILHRRIDHVLDGEEYGLSVGFVALSVSKI